MTSVPVDMEKHKLNIEVCGGKITATWNQLFEIANYTLQYSTSEAGSFEEYKMTFNEYQISVNTSIFSADTMYFRVMATEDGIVEIPSKIVAFSLPQYKVTFMDGANVVLTQSVKMGNDATPPAIQKEGCDLSWDATYTNVKSDITINAVWTKNENAAESNVQNKVQESKATKVTGLSIKNKKNRQLVFKWKKQKDVDGYQIQIALKKNFKKGKKAKATYTNKLTWKGLKKGKTYYVRVRAYTYDKSNNKKYGAFSVVKRVKIKK